MTPSEIRHKLMAGGYSPIPVEGKIPALKAWERKFETNDDEIKFWATVYNRASNTGVLTERTPCIDIDIKMPEAAEAVEALARERFEEGGYFLVRIGEWPKRCIPLRTEEPFPKIISNLTAPSGATEKIELLARGQQAVFYGTH